MINSGKHCRLSKTTNLRGRAFSTEERTESYSSSCWLQRSSCWQPGTAHGGRQNCCIFFVWKIRPRVVRTTMILCLAIHAQSDTTNQQSSLFTLVVAQANSVFYPSGKGQWVPITRDCSLQQNTEFWAKLQNLSGIFAEFSINLVLASDKGTNVA